MRFTLMALAAAVSTLSVAAPILAQDAPAAAPVKEKKICRRDQVTGSILGGKAVCHTKAEWKAIDARNEENADRTLDRDRQRQNSRVTPSGSNGL